MGEVLILALTNSGVSNTNLSVGPPVRDAGMNSPNSTLCELMPSVHPKHCPLWPWYQFPIIQSATSGHRIDNLQTSFCGAADREQCTLYK